MKITSPLNVCNIFRNTAIRENVTFFQMLNEPMQKSICAVEDFCAGRLTSEELEQVRADVYSAGKSTPSDVAVFMLVDSMLTDCWSLEHSLHQCFLSVCELKKIKFASREFYEYQADFHANCLKISDEIVKQKKSIKV